MEIIQKSFVLHIYLSFYDIIGCIFLWLPIIPYKIVIVIDVIDFLALFKKEGVKKSWKRKKAYASLRCHSLSLQLLSRATE